MERRKVDILCVQETRKKGRNARNMRRESDRLMCVKVEIDREMVIVVSGYAPQVGC